MLKANWTETKRHFTAWWERRGMVVGMWGAPWRAGVNHAEAPPPPASPREAHADAALRARRNDWDLRHQCFPADAMPIACTNIGPGSLALYLGCEPGFSPETVWFEPCWEQIADPESLPPIRFDPANPWWRTTEATLRACREAARGDYLVGCPDLCENIDILTALRGSQTLLTDMVERPEWVAQKVAEIDRAWFEVYDRVYDIIRDDDGSSAFHSFYVWGPGKSAKVQCDASAMISPDMFRQFVVPSLTAQCEWLDHSMYHLDGTQAICHLDALLEIEALDAIEWTPQAGLERSAHPRWFDLYRRILAAGKSVQVCGVSHEEIPPVLDAIGGNGVYFITSFTGERDAEKIMDQVAPYR